MKNQDIICSHCKDSESFIVIQTLDYNARTKKHYEIYECYNCHKFFIVYYGITEIKKLVEEE